MAIAADAVLILHLVFILFVVAGGFLVPRWPRLAWLHLPCLLWAVALEFSGWICPLTPLEISLRRAAGESGYTGEFIRHYLVPVIYPPGLTRGQQIALALLLLLVNLVVYGYLWRRRRGRATVDKPHAND